MDCNLAARVLLEQTLVRPSKRAKARARRHFMLCARCRGQLREVWSAVHADHAICESVQELLPHYLAAISTTGDPARRFPGVTAHLGGCHRCASVYHDLRLALAGQSFGASVGIDPCTGPGAIAPQVPEPDLSFLPSPEGDRATDAEPAEGVKPLAPGNVHDAAKLALNLCQKPTRRDLL